VDVVAAPAYEDVPFSEFLHRPAAAADRLNSVRALRLRRRDAGDLALIRADQLDRDNAVVDLTAKLLAGFARLESMGVVRDLLPHALPWVAFLPEQDVDQFVAELIEVAQGAAALGNLSPVAVLLTQWRHTAEVYADPVLLEILTREPEGDLGPVPEPEP
jgi:hypothetical protein